MMKKIDAKERTEDRNTAKVWCPDGENFEFIKVCEAQCKKKDRCKPFQDYFEPSLF
jgi:hypothetical protein